MDDVYLQEIEENEYTKQDKLDLLTYSRISVFFGVFFGIVLLTNLFLVNLEKSNPITLGWGILTTIITLVHVIYIVWNIQEARRLANVTDIYATRSDELETRIVFIIYFFFFILFSLYFLAFGIAKFELNNYFLLEHQTRQLEQFTEFLAQKGPWINCLSLLNLLVLLHIIYTSYALTGSQYAIRYYIYTAASAMILISFFIINQKHLLSSIFQGSAEVFKFDNWNDTVARQFAIYSLPLLIIMFLGNHLRMKNLLLMTGSILLVMVAVQSSAAGQSFREYREISNYFKGRCNIELGEIDHQFIQKWRCANKYDYQNKQECPQDTANIAGCLKNVHTCSRDKVVRVWETSITRVNTVPIYGCIEQKCCGGLNLLYSEPVLVYCLLMAAWCVIGFSLAVFAFLINSQEQGDPLDSSSTTFFFILLLIVLITGGSLLAFNQIEPVPRTPFSYNLRDNNRNSNLLQDIGDISNEDIAIQNPLHDFSHNKQIQHHSQKENLKHDFDPSILEAAAAGEDDNSIDSIDQFKPQGTCKNFLATAIPKQGNSKLRTYAGQVVTRIEDFDTLDFFVPDDEKITTGSSGNIGYLVCVSAYKQGTNRYPTVFNLRPEFKTNLHLKAYEVDGYSCGKHVIELQNPNSPNYRYQDDQSYTGVIGYQPDVIQFLSQYLEVCNGDPMTSSGTYSIMGVQVDFDLHDGTRFFSSQHGEKSFTQLSKVASPNTGSSAVKDKISIRYVQFTTLSEQLGFNYMQNAFVALDAHNLGKCVTDFQKSPIKKANINKASFLSTTNDIGKTHVVMIARIETASVTPTNPINRSAFVGNPQNPSRYALYAWRFVQNGVNKNIEFNCREFQVSYLNEVLGTPIVISPLLSKTQVRIVLQWRDPTVDLDLNSSFGVENDFLCQVSGFTPACGNLRHAGNGVQQPSGQQHAIATEIITVDRLGPYNYLFFVSLFVQLDQRVQKKNVFGSALVDSLPTVTYYYYQGVGRDAVATIITTDATTFTSCPNQSDNCELNSKDSDTVDVALNVFCVNGGKTSLPLLYGRDGIQEGQFGVYWDTQHYSNRFEQIVDRGAPVFPMNTVCQDEFNQPALINS